MGGFFTIPRELLESWPFTKKPYCEGMAYISLLSMAAWKERPDFTNKGELVPLNRGQLCISLRNLGKQWGWNKDKVSRFLNRLQKMGRIKFEKATNTKTGTTVITICNYNDIQLPLKSGETINATTTRQSQDNGATQKNKNQEYKKGNEETLLEGFQNFWDAFSHKMDRPAAEKAWAKAIKKASPEHLTQKAGEYHHFCQSTKTKQKYAQGWLNGECWSNDYQQHITQGNKHGNFADQDYSAGTEGFVTVT